MIAYEREDIRCPHCNRLLFKTVAVVGAQIKCPRCKQLVSCEKAATPITLTDLPKLHIFKDIPEFEVLKE